MQVDLDPSDKSCDVYNCLNKETQDIYIFVKSLFKVTKRKKIACLCFKHRNQLGRLIGPSINRELR